MPIYKMSAPDGNTYQISGPDGATDDQIRAEILRQHPTAGTPAQSLSSSEPAAPPTTGGTFGHGILRGVLPSVAGIAAGSFGAGVGAVGGVPGAIVGGLAAGTAASEAVSMAQESFLKNNPHIANFLGLSEEQQTAEQKSHPYAAMAGEMLPNLVAFRPGLTALRSLANAATPEAKAAIIAARVHAGINAGVGGGMEAGQEAMSDQPMDPIRIAEAAAMSGLGQKETFIGKKISGLGERFVDPVLQKTIDAMRRPQPYEPPASTSIDTTKPSTTVDEKTAHPGTATFYKPDGTSITYGHDDVLDAFKKLDYNRRNLTNLGETLGLKTGRDEPDADDLRGLVRNLRDKPDSPISWDFKRRLYVIKGEERTLADGSVAPEDEENVKPTTDSKPVTKRPRTGDGVLVQPEPTERGGKIPTGDVDVGLGSGERVPEPLAGTEENGKPPLETKTEQQAADVEQTAPSKIKTSKVVQPDENTTDQRVIDQTKAAEAAKETVAKEITTEPEKNRKTSVNLKDDSNSLVDRVDNLIGEVHSDREHTLRDLRDRILETQNPDELKKLSEEVARNEALPPDVGDAPQRIYKPDNQSAGLVDRLNVGDFHGAVEHLASDTLADEGRDPLHRELAKYLLGKVDKVKNVPGSREDVFGNIKLNVEGTSNYDAQAIARLKDLGATAGYDPATNTMHFTKEGMTDANVMHEAVHAVTTKVLRQSDINPMHPDLSDEQRFAANHIYDLLEQSLKIPNLVKNFPEALVNRYEFVAHGIADRNFQEALAKYRLQGDLAKRGYAFKKGEMTETQKKQVNGTDVSGKVSIWNSFTKAIKGILGIGRSMSEGNMALELSEAFNDILKAPTKSGVKGVGLLTSKNARGRTFKVPEHPKFATPEEGAKYVINEKLNAAKLTLASMDKKISFYDKFQKAVIALQSDRRILKDLDDSLISSGVAKYDENSQLVYSALMRSSGIASDLNSRYIKIYNEKINSAVDKYSKALGLTPVEALARLDALFMARHEPIRRYVHYLKNAPLDNITRFDVAYSDAHGKKYTRNDTAEGHRQHILNDRLKSTDDLVTGGQASEDRKVLENIIFKTDANGNRVVNDKYVKATGESKLRNGNKPISIDMNDDIYSVIGGYDKKSLDGLRDMYKQELQNPKTAAHLNEITSNLRQLQENTKMLQRRANFWTQQVDNMSSFYGKDFQDTYVPFKGRPDEVGSRMAELNDEYDLGSSKRFGSGYSDVQDEFGGRKTDSSNTLLQSQADGVQAAMRVGRKDVTRSIKNLIDQFPSLGRKLTFESEEGGGKKDYIDLRDRERAGEMLSGGLRKFFNYGPDGRIEVYEFNPQNTKMAEAIRRTYITQDDVLNRGINAIGSLTQKVSMGHTRLNLAFAPFNFVRHALTNTTAIMAEMGYAKGGQFLGRMVEKITDGGVLKTYQFAKLYEEGKFKEIDAMAAKDPYIKDLQEFIKRGGRTSWVEGLSNQAKYDKLLSEVKAQGGVAKTADQIRKITDHYGDMFELTTRANAFATAKEFNVEQFVKDNKRQPTAAEREGLNDRAATFTKELINYEHSGTYGRQLGSLFSFWRANATGAVRAMDALMPAFLSPEAFLKQLPHELQHEVQLKKAINNFTAKNKRAPDASELANLAKSEAVVKAKEASDKLVARFMERKKTSQILMASLFGAGMVAYNMSYMLAGNDEQNRNEVANDDKSMWTRSWRIPLGKDAMGKDNNFIQIPWGFGGGALAGIGAQAMALLYGHSKLSDFAGNTILLIRESYLPLPAAEFNIADDPLAWAADSILPSIFRPIVEYKMNKDTFGRQIHNSNMSKYGGVYEGGDYIPQIYQDASRHLAEWTNGAVTWDPATLHYFSSNWVDGYARIAQTIDASAHGLMGDKAIDPKVALLPFANFIGKRTSVDAREYAEMEKNIKDMQEKLNTLSVRPDVWRAYVSNNPEAPKLVAMYDKINGGPLKKITTAIHELQTSDRPPAEYADQIKQLKETRDMVMRRAVEYYNSNGY